MFVEYYQGTNIMLEDFLSYIVEELSINRADKLLLAVSGGVDSMVMLDLFHRSDFDIHVAHINHSTRNGQSDKDADFVQQVCKKLGIPCYIKVLDYATLAKGNFQANARSARYAFFDSIINDKKLKYLATAHHMNDRWETFVMNLNRKSGITGLTSLKPRTNTIIRPLMMYTKSEVKDYAVTKNITYVEDSSNDTDDYTRNKVRHHISNAASDIFPDFIKNVNQSISNLEKSNQLIDSLIGFGGFVEQTKGGNTYINLEKIKSTNTPLELLYHILAPCGFSLSDSKDMINTESTGSLFYSSTHEALYDRGSLIIRIKKEKITNSVILTSSGIYNLQDGRTVIYSNDHETDSKNTLEFIYPIKKTEIAILRSIKPGDKYKPAHMNGKTKSIKKLLNDYKVDRFTKENLLVLEVNGEIKKIIGLKKS